ncbi:MAG: FtsX-like permease family protein [Campylobacteraceae bacterium]|jgi:putative ABC transport system permease protein|nr:FtsX-like permease family protein [Campylobacteraceae bacterium]
MIGLIWNDFKRMWAGSLVIVLLIASVGGFWLFITLTSESLREGSAKAAQRFDLIVGAAGSETQLVLSLVYLQKSPLPLLDGKYYHEISKSNLTDWAAPTAFGDYYKGFSIIGTTDTLVTDNNHLNLTSGRVFKEPYEAVAGINTGLSIGDTFTPLHGEGHHAHDEIKYKVVGIAPFYESAWDRAIFVPIESVWHIHGLDEHDEDEYSKHDDEKHDEHEHDEEEHYHDHASPPISAIVIKPKTIPAAYELRSKYKKDLTQAVFPAEVLSRLYAILGDVSKILSDIAFAGGVLSTVVITAVSILYIKLRRRQIASLRAFGANANRIFLMIWLGFTTLVCTGCAIGIAAAFFAAKITAAKLSAEQGFKLIVWLGWSDFGVMALFLAVLSILLLIPCALIYRYSAAECLRNS